MKMKLFLFLFVSFIFISCKENKKNIETKNILKEWIGQTIKFPDIKPFCLLSKDSILEIDNKSKDYKILLYVDSTGCTICQLRLAIWKTYIEELGDKIEFLFYLRPKTERELSAILKIAQFNYPVFIDRDNELNKLNQLPSNPQYQCFLLDSNDRIVSVGNPANNHEIWELYTKIITNRNLDKPLITSVIVGSEETEIRKLQVGKTFEIVYTLENCGSQPLVIQRVDASCGCTVPNWEKQPITAGKTTKIRVRVTPEEKGYFHKTITVHCNVINGQLVFHIKRTIED
jgi:hypothetical protein